jgi:serine/threonine-protein kinase
MKPEDSEETRTELTREPSTPPDTGEPPTLRLPSRYALGPKLGHGGFGTVFAARDKLVGRDVAIKVLSAHRASAILERETSALRLLDLPGVVRLLDSGASDGVPWFVMERIEGTHFPDSDVPVPWASLERTVLELLRALARIHRAGFVHGDIKPSNVIVQANGDPVILDLGLARSRQAGTARTYGGTPLYMAPEQIAGGAAVAASDIYAVGLMLWRALTGCWPHGDIPLGGTLTARLERDPRLTAEDAVVPVDLAALIADMLQRNPARPMALTCVERLVPPKAALLLDPPPANPTDLARFFAGRERLFHIPSTSAKILWDRAEGDTERMRRTIQSWLLLGVATLTDAGVNVPLDTLERLHAGWAPEREAEGAGSTSGAIPGTPLAQILSLASGDDRSIASTALELAARERARGNLRVAAVCLREGLRACWRTEDFGLEGSLVAAAADLALEDRSLGALDEAIDLIGRGRVHAGRELELLRAARALQDGRREVAIAILEEEHPSDPIELQRARHDLRVQVTVNGPLDPDLLIKLETSLEEWTRESGSDERSHLHRWRARIRYRQLLLEEAGREAEMAAVSAMSPFGRMQSLIYAAAAFLEIARVGQTETLAQDARSLASALRLPVHEARTEWFSRVIKSRCGTPTEPDLDLLDAARGLQSPHTHGLIAVTEAAICWRAHNPLSRSLAAEAATAFKAAEYSEAFMCARALEIACGSPSDDVTVLAKQACEAQRPDVAVEVLGLLAMSSKLTGDWRSAFEEQAKHLTWRDPAWRSGVLSIVEARRAIESAACS